MLARYVRPSGAKVQRGRQDARTRRDAAPGPAASARPSGGDSVSPTLATSGMMRSKGETLCVIAFWP
jgi:hypothetical protein